MDGYEHFKLNQEIREKACAFVDKQGTDPTPYNYIRSRDDYMDAELFIDTYEDFTYRMSKLLKRGKGNSFSFVKRAQREDLEADSEMVESYEASIESDRSETSIIAEEQRTDIDFESVKLDVAIEEEASSAISLESDRLALDIALDLEIEGEASSVISLESERLALEIKEEASSAISLESGRSALDIALDLEIEGETSSVIELETGKSAFEIALELEISELIKETVAALRLSKSVPELTEESKSDEIALKSDSSEMAEESEKINLELSSPELIKESEPASSEIEIALESDGELEVAMETASNKLVEEGIKNDKLELESKEVERSALETIFESGDSKLIEKADLKNLERKLFKTVLKGSKTQLNEELICNLLFICQQSMRMIIEAGNEIILQYLKQNQVLDKSIEDFIDKNSMKKILEDSNNKIRIQNNPKTGLKIRRMEQPPGKAAPSHQDFAPKGLVSARIAFYNKHLF